MAKGKQITHGSGVRLSSAQVRMGIRGLFSFVESCEDFFEDVKLSGGKIIIDGSNLRYLLYYWCPGLNSSYGGDYRKYYKYVTAFIKKLQQCGLTPVVVLDGAHDTTGVKKATVVKRARDQVKKAVEAADGRGRGTVYPIFGVDVFCQALKDLNVEMIQSNFEADRYIAELARREDCPVASNDSDFFVYDVDFMPLDSIGMSTVQIADDGSRYLVCRRFNKKKFLGDFGLTSSDHLYLMSSVLGNDYIPIHTFEKFFNQVKMPKKKSLNPRRKQMLGFLWWLSREPDATLAVDKILSHISMTERPKLKSLIENSVAVYKSGDDSNDAVSSKVRLWDSIAVLPSWFVDEFRLCIHPNWIMDAICNGMFILQSQIESKSSISSHLFALPILTASLDLCFHFGKSFPVDLKLYTREGGTSKAVTIECLGGGKGLDELRGGATEEERRLFMATIVACDNVKDLPEGLELISLSLWFWTRTETAPVSRTLWKSLAFSWFLETCLEQDKSIPAFRDLVTQLESVSPESRQTLAERTKRLKKAGADMKKHSLEAVKTLSNLQAVLYHVNVASGLLNTGWRPFSPVEAWDGTLIFNVHHDLDGHNDIENRCAALLGLDENMTSSFEKLIAVFRPFTEAVSTAEKTGGRGAKKKSRKKKTGDSDVVVQDLGNRFALLGVD